MISIKNAIEALLNNRELSVTQAADRYFSAHFRQRINGIWLDRPAFLAGISELRLITDKVTVTVLDEFKNGAHYAERHTIDFVKHDGERMHQEVYLFAQTDADGRFVTIEEATLQID